MMRGGTERVVRCKICGLERELPEGIEVGLCMAGWEISAAGRTRSTREVLHQMRS